MTDGDGNGGTRIRRPRPGGTRMREELARIADGDTQAHKAPGPAGAPTGTRVSARGEGSGPERRPRLPRAHLGLSDAQARNPFVAAGAELFALLARAARVTDLDEIAQGQLRDRAGELVKRFRQRLEARGIARDQLDDATFCLCTHADQMAGAAPWGGRGPWLARLLRVEFFRDVEVGQRLRSVVDRCRRDPTGLEDLREFLFLLFALGLQTRELDYERLKDELAGSARPGATLSPHWEGASTPLRAVRTVPVWVVAAVTVSVLLFAFTGFRFALNQEAEPVLATLSGMGFQRLEAPGLASTVAPDRAEAPRLAELLAREVAAGEVQVVDREHVQIVRLEAPGFFPSGSAEPSAAHRPLLSSVVAALGRLEGRVDVIGHTDDVPIRSLRYQSNTELSYARAERIAAELRSGSTGLHVSHVGRGASEPLCNEPTAACHARNRRVEIIYRQG